MKHLKASGLTVREFAEKAQINRPLVYFYIQGQRRPTKESARKIAKAFGVPMDEITPFISHVGRPYKNRM